MFRTSQRWLGHSGITMASSGFSRRGKTSGLCTVAAFLWFMVPDVALAQDPRVAIPAEPLDQALTLLARQTGADIISTEAGLGRVHVPGITGQMSPREALRRLLQDSGYRAVVVDRHSFRIVRDAAPRVRRSEHGRAVPAGDDDIVVTASKQKSTLLRFPGSAILIGGFAPGTIAGRAVHLDDVARNTPVLQNTEFGMGRNKIFIRGVADSSFNGATQSTASLYFDEVPAGLCRARTQLEPVRHEERRGAGGATRDPVRRRCHRRGSFV